MNDIILISHLNLFLGNKKILDDINLKIKYGENLVLMGGSGSGKSVLVKTIAGFFKYNDGSIEIEGTKAIYPVEDNIKKHNIGFVFQHNALFDSLPIWENISFGLLRKYSIGREFAKQKAVKALKLVGLEEDVADKFPNELSGGMQKRIAILRTAILKPKIIIFDEPTGGLDPIASKLISNYIANLDGGAIKIIITHDINVAKRTATNIVMLYRGRVVWYGKINEMLHSDNKYIKKFIAALD